MRKREAVLPALDLAVMNGKEFKSRSDNTANCGVNLDTPGLAVEL